MTDFLQEQPRSKSQAASSGYRRLFVLVFAVALLGQLISFIQSQLAQYHQNLSKDFKVILVVNVPADNTLLSSWGESLSAKADILSVRLFAPQDGLTALQLKNPRFTEALVALGRESMPAYFELQLTDQAINNIRPFVQNIAAEYSQLSVKYSPEQADMIFYSGVCLRTLQFAAVLSVVCFVLFMFLVEAYPSRRKSHAASGVLYGVLAGGCSLGVLVLFVYPTGLLIPALQHFTSVERQLGLFVFCGLFGWTLDKWKKF